VAQLKRYAVDLADVIGSMRRPRMEMTQDMIDRGIRVEPQVDVTLPNPWDEITEKTRLPSIMRAPGQREPSEILSDIQESVIARQRALRATWDQGLKVAADKKAYRQANPQPPIYREAKDTKQTDAQRASAARAYLTEMETTAQSMADATSNRILNQANAADATVIPGSTELMQHGASELDKAFLDMEQETVWIGRQLESGAFDPRRANDELMDSRARYLARIEDVHRVINETLDQAKQLEFPAARQASMVDPTLLPWWRGEMNDIATTIAGYPATRSQAREAVEQYILDPANVPPAARTGMWSYAPVREAIEAGTAPQFMEDLWDAHKIDPKVAAVNWKNSTGPAQQQLAAWANANGYAQPITTPAEFDTFMKTIENARTVDANILASGVDQLQDDLQTARVTANEFRAALARKVRTELEPNAALADIEEANREVMRANFSSNLAQRQLGRGAQGGLTEGVFEAFLSPQQSQWFRANASARMMNDYLGELAGDKRKLYVAVEAANAKYKLGLTQDEIMARLRGRPKETIDFLNRYSDPDAANLADKIFKKWVLHPFPAADDEAMQTWNLIAARMLRDKRSALGIGKYIDRFDDMAIIGPLLHGMKLTDAALVEEMLASPATLMANLGGGIILSAMFSKGGVGHAMDVLRNAGENLRKVMANVKPGSIDREGLAEIDYYPTTFQNIHRELGIEPAANLTQQTRSALAVQSGTTRTTLAGRVPGLGEEEAATAIEQINPWLRGAGGALAGASMGAPFGPPGLLAGAILGGLHRVKFDPAYKTVMGALFNGVEGALRGTRSAERWIEMLPFLEAKMQKFITDAIPSQTMRAPRVTPDQEIAGRMSLEDFLKLADQQQIKPRGNPNDALDEAFENGRILPAHKLRDLLVRNGVGAEQAARVASDWSGLLYAARDEATTYANKTNFDYLDTSNLEEKARALFLFPIWAFRFPPLVAEYLAQHPQFVWAIMKLNEMDERNRKEANLPEGMHGYSGGAGLGSLMANMLYSRAGYFGANVPRGLFGNYAALGQADEIHADNPAGQAIQGIQNVVGLGLRPRWRIPLELLGALNESPFEMWRMHPIMESAATMGLTAFNALSPEGFPELPVQIGTAEAPLIEGRRFLREALSRVTGATTSAPSLTGSPLKDTMIRRRIVELAYEQNGQRPQGPYAQALNSPDATPEAKQIWNTAREDVEKVMAVQTLLNNATPVRWRYVGGAEQELRGQQEAVAEQRDHAQQILQQQVKAGLLTPDQATQLEYEAQRQALAQDPLGNVLYDLSGGTIDTQQRARAEFRAYQQRIMHLPQRSQYRLIREFLNERPDIARALNLQEPGAIESMYQEIQRGR
jgi:hypothetical protein